MPLDNISLERLSVVHPLLSQKVEAMASILEGEGIVVRVTQGLRSWHDQQELWNKGRDKQGNITDPKQVVTHARPGYSWHQFALAADLVPLDMEGKPDWNGLHPQWGRIVKVSYVVGLKSGAEWRTFPDYPHVQLSGIPDSPTDEVRQLFLDGGILSVWQHLALSLT